MPGGGRARAQAPSQDTSARGSQGSQSSQSSSGPGNAFQQNQSVGSTPGGSPDACDGASLDEVVLPSPVTPTGVPSYYDGRVGNFNGRYPCGQFTLPGYYLNYGRKYCQRFTTELRPKLSSEGQAWLDRAAMNLQQAIENRLAAGPEAFDSLEKDDAAFQAFAYGTHADAYLNAGLRNLNVFDLARVALTPDVGDLVTQAGLQQAAEVGIRLLPQWGEDAVDWTFGEGTTSEMVDAAYEGAQMVGDGIDEAFGEGTSDQICEAVDTTVEVIGEGAADAYDVVYGVAEEGTGWAIDQIESVTGEGSVDQGLNDARRWGQNRIDDVEDAWDWLVN